MTDGELVIRVVAMPGDTNPDGDMFGGWVLSQMDLGAYVQARKYTQTKIVTVAIDNIFDKDPSFARLDLNYDPFTAIHPLGRTVKVAVKKKF